MFTEIHPGNYDRVRALFADLTYHIQVPSILAGNTRGRVLVDDPAEPRVALIWDQLAALYIVGPLDNSKVWAAIARWITDEPVAQGQRIGIPSLTVAHHPKALADQIRSLLEPYELTPGLRYYHTHSQKPVGRQAVPDGFELRRIGSELLTQENRPGQRWLLEWILSFWPTTGDFLEKGLGYVALAETGRIVSLCITVFDADQYYELGTATDEAYRRRGLSSAAAGACVDDCLAQNREPIWHCWADNIASVRVARKIGFRIERTYEVLRLAVPRTSQSS